MKRYTLVASAVLSVTALTIAGCGSGVADARPKTDFQGEHSEYLSSLYQDALDKGQTDILGYVPNPAAFEPWVEAFNEYFPEIEVELVPLFGPELDTRLNSEIATGGISADFTNLGEGELLKFRDNGWLEQYVPETMSGIDPIYIGLDDMWITPALNIQGPIYNTDRVSAEEAPSSWKDLTDPSFKGRVGNTPPTTSGGFPMATTEANNLGIIDETWLEGLAAQEPSYFPSSANTVQALISGEIDLYTTGPYVVYNGAKKKGAPLAFAFLEEGNMAIRDAVALFKESPNQAGAKLFLAWLFTPEAQTISLKETGRPGTMPNAPKMDGLKEAHVVTIEALQNDYPAWRETLKRILE
ncbi:ABC transporter substrate-binding protein [Arthrobacter sulfonylureivorans]|uniref:Extracellular solute-binding protein n=1 Tax=Arthrobacter sulfonylureivorans TaxID=2486855 RepID=A0ABY3WFG6_9MICC|nr:extracellular solute-binding protein [Arthrobacter sulfonylureivorans]UNK47116.1 extracellular solute-binding protein [Arthrobacter sulfonylureivorans]